MSSPTFVKEFPSEEEYQKKNGIIPEDISKLRQWLDTQPHLPGPYISELDLILTYHCCDRSSEVSKQVLDLHFTLRSLFTNFFKDRVVDDKVMKTMDVVLALGLDGRSHDDYAIFYARLIDYEVKKFVFHEILRMVIMAIDLWQYGEGTWPGAVVIIDLEGMALGHLARLDIQTLQQFLYYLQEALLLKLKSIHFANAPSFMDKLMLLLRPFLKKEFLDMISIHHVGSKTLEKFIPMTALPKNAGGEFKTNEQARDDMKAKFKANAEFFVSENQKRAVEALRPGKPKTISDIFGGVEGSFKKLEID